MAHSPKADVSEKALTDAQLNRGFDELAEAIKLADERWDILMIGDGSGSRWGNGIGWAVAVSIRTTGEKLVLHGAVSNGTNNVAELFPYIHALNWFYETRSSSQRERYAQRGLKVHIVTDSEYVVKTGQKTAQSLNMKAHRVLWTAIGWWQKLGMVIHWHHVDRESLLLQRHVDRLGRWARLALSAAR